MSDIEIRVKQRNLALNDYIVLKLDDMEILHTSPSVEWTVKLESSRRLTYSVETTGFTY